MYRRLCLAQTVNTYWHRLEHTAHTWDECVRCSMGKFHDHSSAVLLRSRIYYISIATTVFSCDFIGNRRLSIAHLRIPTRNRCCCEYFPHFKCGAIIRRIQIACQIFRFAVCWSRTNSGFGIHLRKIFTAICINKSMQLIRTFRSTFFVFFSPIN